MTSRPSPTSFPTSRPVVECTLLSTRIPATAAYKSAATSQLPVHRVDRKTRGKTPCAAEVMSSLVQELGLLPSSA